MSVDPSFKKKEYKNNFQIGQGNCKTTDIWDDSNFTAIIIFFNLF